MRRSHLRWRKRSRPRLQNVRVTFARTSSLSINSPTGSSDASEAVELSLIDGTGDAKALATFHPRFTYSVFGDEESIFGYKDLQIKIGFRADNCKPLVNVTYSDKFKPVANVKAADIEEVLKDFLPSGNIDCVLA